VHRQRTWVTVKKVRQYSPGPAYVSGVHRAIPVGAWPGCTRGHSHSYSPGTVSCTPPRRKGSCLKPSTSSIWQTSAQGREEATSEGSALQHKGRATLLQPPSFLSLNPFCPRLLASLAQTAPHTTEASGGREQGAGSREVAYPGHTWACSRLPRPPRAACTRGALALVRAPRQRHALPVPHGLGFLSHALGPAQRI